MSSNTLFDTYEDEWRTLTDDLYSAIAKIPALAAGERERQVKSVKEKLQDAEDAVDGMSIACRGVENGSALLARLKDYRSELDSLKKQFQKSQFSLNANAKNDLLGPDDFAPEDVVKGHRALFDAGGRDSVGLLEASGDHITQATRDLYETEQTAMRVMQDLDEQRTVMERFRDRLQGINASLDTAGALMQGMMKRIWGNKIVLGFVMVLLLGGIVAVIFLRFFYPWGASSGASTTAPAVTAPPANTTKLP